MLRHRQRARSVAAGRSATLPRTAYGLDVSREPEKERVRILILQPRQDGRALTRIPPRPWQAQPAGADTSAVSVRRSGKLRMPARGLARPTSWRFALRRKAGDPWAGPPPWEQLPARPWRNAELPPAAGWRAQLQPEAIGAKTARIPSPLKPGGAEATPGDFASIARRMRPWRGGRTASAICPGRRASPRPQQAHRVQVLRSGSRLRQNHRPGFRCRSRPGARSWRRRPGCRLPRSPASRRCCCRRSRAQTASRRKGRPRTECCAGR